MSGFDCNPPHTLSIAPMIQYTDSHWRTLFRSIASRPLLYTEMVMDEAITNNASRRGLSSLRPWLTTNACEQPLALQLGGGGLGGVTPSPTSSDAPSSTSSLIDVSAIERLASAASLSLSYASSFGASPFSELNLNCGCPSDSAKKRGFGADLMRPLSRAHTVACVKAVVRQVGHELPVTVKCRIGVLARPVGQTPGPSPPDAGEHNRVGYERLKEFVADMSGCGVRRMVIHCRVCVLCGLSTGENRSVPPLRRYLVNGLCRDFPEMEFVVNGGVTSLEEAEGLLGWREGGWKKTECDDEIIGEATGKERTVLCQCGKRTFNLGSDEDWSTTLGGGGCGGGGDTKQYFPKGVMIGRFAYNDVASFWDSDSRFFGATNRDPTMRTVVEEYAEYAEKVIIGADGWGEKEDDSEEDATKTGGGRNVALPTLLKPMHNLFTGARGNRFFKRKLDSLLKETKRNGDDSGLFSELVWEAIKGNVDDAFLDARLSESRRSGTNKECEADI